MIGEYGVCALDDMEFSRFTISKPTQTFMSSISYDGCFLAVCDGYAKNTIYVVDLVKKTPYVNKSQ